MSINRLPIAEAYEFKAANPACALALEGDVGIIYTDEDMLNDLAGGRRISIQEFLERFTDDETDAFLEATKTDSTAAKLYFKITTTQEPVALDKPSVQSYMSYLEAIGVITAARKTAILS